MAGSEFYDHTSYPSQGAVGSSSAARAEFELIEAGFNKCPPLSGNGGKLVAVNAGGTAMEALTAAQALAAIGAQAAANKDASGGYAGLTLFKLNLRNAANTFTSFLTNANTASRTYTGPNKDGTLALTSDFAAPGPIGSTTPAAGSFTTLSAMGSLGTISIDSTGSQALFSRPASNYLIATSVGGRFKFRVNGDGFDTADISSTGLAVTGALSATGVYSVTTASAANVFVDTAGNLARSTSTAALKTAVEDMEPALALRLVELFRAVWYRSLCPGDNADWSWFGGIAEEVALIDPRFVHYGYLDTDYEQVAIDDGEVQEPVTDVVLVDQSSIEIQNGVPVQIVKPVETQVPRVTHTQVVDAAGNPVTTPQTVTDAEGVESTVLVPLMYPVPVMQTVRKSHQVRQLKADAKLSPVGLQYERFTVPLMVVTKLQNARLTALEAA